MMFRNPCQTAAPRGEAELRIYNLKKRSPPQRRSKAVVCVRTPRMYPRSGYFLVFSISLQHLEESQISGRKRFIALRKDQMEKVAQQEFEQHLETFDEVLLPENHPYYDRVAKVAARILNSNTEYEEIKTKKWTISVVDQEDQNAFVLPSGNIFVFTGIS